ncbi:MAG: N-acetylmuramic acid 6-phosphate etherase [candidate division WOR-3 bacterium]
MKHEERIEDYVCLRYKQREEEEVFEEVETLRTEMQNPRTKDLDKLSTKGVLELINAEDHLVAPTVKAALPEITKATEDMITSLRAGGRIVHVGAGASGMVAVADSTEMTPTFSVPYWRFIGVIAGGPGAAVRSSPGAEDNEVWAEWDMKALNLTPNDMVIGLSASGRAPYVRTALKFAKSRGCRTALITTNPKRNFDESFIDTVIVADVGPEVIAGSTRMKSMQAQLMIVHMMSTAAMVRLGKTYGNIMVDVCAATEKLVQRAKKIIMLMTGLDYEAATKLLMEAGGSAKVAIVMHKRGVDRLEARRILAENNGFLRGALGEE